MVDAPWKSTLESRPALAETLESEAVADASSSPEPTGRRIGRFAVLRELGRGVMGQVYLGYDEQLDRKVAIKLLRVATPSESASLRLLREAQALAKLSHPNVVQIHEVGTEAGAVYLAMEYVDGATLAAWAKTEPDWRARVEMLIQAGRGMAAAHAVGLVHRDFKPDNVLVGRDRRVRVLDFGLVRSDEVAHADPEGYEVTASRPILRPAGELEAMPNGTPFSPLNTGLTAHGTVLGTPPYMAPEQHEGRTCDAAADQYSFCVTAFRVLFGLLPFEEREFEELARAKSAEKIAAFPPESPVPPAIRAAILRGLSADPRARWESVDSLLVVLAGALDRRRGGFAAAAGIFAGALGVGLGLHALTPAPPAPCALEPSALAGVWDDDRRDALRASFDATDLLFEADAAAGVEGSLDRWAEAWSASREENCRATRIESTQSELLLERRELCLRRQLVEVGALVKRFVHADEQVVSKAGTLVDELPDSSRCGPVAVDADAQILLSPQQRAAVEVEVERLVEARTEHLLGRAQRARELGERVRERAQVLGYTPLELEAEVFLAQALVDSGDLDGGVAALRRAILAAERVGLGELVASFRVQLAVAVAGRFAKPTLEEWAIEEAQLALDRVARPDDARQVDLLLARARIIEQAGDHKEAIAAHELAWSRAEGLWSEASRARLRVGIGTAHYRAGDYEAARAELERSLEVIRASWGRWSPAAARIEFNLGMITSDLDDPVAAAAHLDAALEIDTQLWGAGSVEVARDRFALAASAFATGDLERACDLSRQVLITFEAQLGPDHDETATAHNAAGLCHLNAGELDEAEASYNLALKTHLRVHGPDHFEVGQLRYNLAEVDLRRGELERARDGFEEAQRIYSAALPETHPLQAQPLKGLGLIALEEGDHDEALALLERALELADASFAIELADIHLGLARALLGSGDRGVHARAHKLAEEALRAYEGAGVVARAEEARELLGARD